MKKIVISAIVLISLLGLIGIIATLNRKGMGNLQITGYVTVIDNYGREVTIPKKPERIVSTAPSNTEILFALGLGDKVVGVTKYCNYPIEAKEREKIGGFTTVDVEKVVALEPDLVLAAGGNGEEAIQKLEDLNLTVVVLDPKGIDDILQNIRLVGKASGTEEDALGLVKKMNQRIEAITSKTTTLSGMEKPRVFYVLWHDPLMSAGSGTFADDLIDMAGGINIAHELDGYKSISLENVIEQDPQVIIASVGMNPTTLEYVRNEPRLQGTAAMKDGGVYGIDSDIVSRPGPRIVDALEEFARFIHPELFQQ
ncbi:MAG: ABC transporter substrate-binding protein [Candidatus Hydrothermarchaeales archaeon]